MVKAMSFSNRIHFMENLRSVTIILVILLHTSLCYMAYAPEWWPVLNQERSLLLTVIVLLVDVFIMPVMFFTSGYFLLTSIRRNSTLEFVKKKFWRLLIPWVIGVIFLAPPIAYLIYFTRGIPVSYLDFLSGDFIGKAYQQAHYWFLGVLAGFILIFTFMVKLFPALLEKKPNRGCVGTQFHIGFILVTTALYLTADQFYPLDAWIHPGYVFVFQPVRICNLFGYFLLGTYYERKGWFLSDGYKHRTIQWAFVSFISGVFYILMKSAFPEPELTTILLQGMNALLFNVFCYSTVIFLLAFSKQRLNKTGYWVKNLSDSSYGCYYVHQWFVLGAAYFLTSTHLSLAVKFSLNLFFAIGLSWLIASLLRKAPVLKKIF